MINLLEQKDFEYLSEKLFFVIGILLCGIVITFSLLGGNQVWSSSIEPDSKFNFSDTYDLSNNQNDSVYGQISSLDKNNLALVWQDSNFKITGSNLIDRNYDIFFENFDLNGIIKDDRLNLSNNPGFSEHPHMAVSGNNTYIAWIDNSENVKQVYFRHSENTGQDFYNATILSSNESQASNVDVSAESNFVYVTWQEKNLDHSSVILRISSDFGKTFGDEKVLSNYSSDSYPRIFSQNGTVFVTWNIDVIKSSDPFNYNNAISSEINPGIYFTMSRDEGNTFGAPQLLSNASDFSYGEAQVSAFNNYVYVSWVQKDSLLTFGNLYVAKSVDYGNNFERIEIPLKPDNIFDASNLDTFAYGDKLFLALEASVNTTASLNVGMKKEGGFNKEIFFTVLSQNLTSPKEMFNLSENPGISECPSISLLPNEKIVSVSWEDYTPGNHEILMRQVHY